MAWESNGKKLGDVESGDKDAGADSFRHYVRQGTCPHCGGDLRIHLRAEVADISIPVADLDQADAWKRGLSDDQLSVVEMARETGLLASFKAVVEYTKVVDRPSHIERFFVNFMKMSTQKVVPQFAIDHFSRAFPGTRLSFWTCQGIMAVCANGTIRCFAPKDLICGQRIKKANGNGTGMQLHADPHMLDEWSRTRFGYVAGEGAMFEAMRAKSIGEFARPGL
jgi:hypothetical protein